jgi:RimJ/RimL family protein N-acetyltransferase
VRASNKVAQRLYEKCGFVYEGHRVRQVKHRGEYDDDFLMAWFADSA